MFILKAQKREVVGKKVKNLRRQGVLPAVLYGPKIKNISLAINSKEFDKIYNKAGESSLISLEIDPSMGSGQVKKFPVLIHEVRKDPLTNEPIHVDFYQPILTERIEAAVPLVFEGTSLAVKDLGGTLVKEIQEIIVKALPQNLPHEIKVNIEKLKTFEDEILIKDLQTPEGVELQKKLNEIVAVVTPLEKVEEELEKPIEEKVEEVEGAEDKEKKEKTEEREEEEEPNIKKQTSNK